MRIALSILLVLGFFMGSCQLQRKNPLDPIGNPDVSTPQTVSNLIIYGVSGPGSDNKYVELRWDANNPLTTDGYYVYRGLAYNSAYAVVDTVGTNSCYHGSEPWHSVLPGTYWYKVSAFKEVWTNDVVPEFLGRLEGRQSEARPVVVPA